jgi:glycosyltransferase involved in cell wall biosynthesis
MLVNYEFPPLGGGAGNASYHIARELASLGHEITVLSSGFRGLPQNQTLEGFNIMRIPTIRRHADRCTVFEMVCFILSAIWHSGAVIRQARPQCCLVFFGIPGGPVGLWLKIRYNLPYVLSLRGGDVPGFLPSQLRHYHRLTAPCSHLVWRQASQVCANGEHLKSLAEAFDRKLSIKAISNGVDLERYHPRPADSPTSPPLRLLYVGRLSPQKGLEYLIEALTLIPGIQLHLDLVGDGPQRAELQARCRRLGLDERISFRGWLGKAELPQLYRQSNVFVMPSLDEGLSNALLEAMASGLPVIATSILSQEGLVDEGRNGFLVPAADPASLADRIVWFSLNPAGMTAMGQEARARVEASFSWKSAALACLNLMEETA